MAYPKYRSIVVFAASIFLALASISSLIFNRSGFAGDIDGTLFFDGESLVRSFEIDLNDLVYNRRDGLLYLSIPSRAIEGGNTVTAIDPLSGQVVKRIFAGSEPKRMALSADGSTLYVELAGAASIRRIDLLSGTAQESFAVGVTDSERMTVSDIAVHPGDNALVAVAKYGRYNSVTGISLFRNGVQLPASVQGRRFLEFSSDGVLYAADSGIAKIAVVGSGLSNLATFGWSTDSGIRVLDNKIILPTGSVIDRNNGAQIGTLPFDGWPTTRVFAADSGTNRVFSVTRRITDYKVSIRAFDGTALTLTGSLELPMIDSEPLKVVRFGSNGLAFTTAAGRLVLVQTSLIPNGDPIPTPTQASPTPTPAIAPAIRSSYKVLPVTANNIVHLQSVGRLFASVSSGKGAYGNQLVEIDPFNAEVVAGTFAGSEPNRIARSADERALFVGLDGSLEINKFDVSERRFVSRFKTGSHPRSGPYRISGISVSPSDSNTIAVSRRLEEDGLAGVAIHDGSVPRASVVGRSFGGEFSDSEAAIYGISASGALERIEFDSGGTNRVRPIPFTAGIRIVIEGGLVFGNAGSVLDPVANRLLGQFYLPESNWDRAFAYDARHNRVYFASSQSNRLIISAYDTRTFVRVGELVYQQTSLRPLAMERFGEDGLAIAFVNGPILMIRSSLVDPRTEIEDEPQAPIETPTPVPAQPSLVTKIAVPAVHLVRNRTNGLLYASVPTNPNGPISNSITAFDARTGRIDHSFFAGNNPRRLSFSDGFEKLWVNLDGNNTIRRFDTRRRVSDLEFPTQFQYNGAVIDLDAVPGSSTRVAVTASNNPVSVFDNGVRLPGIGQPNQFGVMSFSDTTGKLLGYNGETSGFEMYRMNVRESGLETEAVSNGLLHGYGCGFIADSGLLYTTSGRVIDAENYILVGTFAGTGRSVAVDRERKRAFYLDNGVIKVFDTETFLPLGEVGLENPVGNVYDLVIAGPGLLAYRVDTGSEKYVNVVRSQLIAPDIPLPSGIQFRTNSSHINETEPMASVVVVRTGDVERVASVDFATRDLTAVAGVDYLTTSGRVVFQPGQTEAVISVPILDDSVHEYSEAFGVVLSNPDGGSILLPRTEMGVNIGDPEDAAVLEARPIVITENENDRTATGDVRISFARPAVYWRTVTYRTVDGTAVGGVDYLPASGSIYFAPGETVKTVRLTVNGDTIAERYENFSLELTNPFDEQSRVVTVVIRDRSLATAPIVPFDYDGDGRTDVSVRRPSDSSWWVQNSANSQVAVMNFGQVDDSVVYGDFSGDRIGDLAVFRSSAGRWEIDRSDGRGVESFDFGLPGDIPAPGDYDGDGVTEAAVFRPSSGTWYIRQSEGEMETQVFGGAGDRPVVGDFDSDGKCDTAVWRAETGEWWQRRSSDGAVRSFIFGQAGDLPIVGDFTGDGVIDVAVFRASGSVWLVRRSEDGSYFSLNYGLSGDIPVPGDYDGDGRMDPAVFRPTAGDWWIALSSGGDRLVYFGSLGDQPLPEIHTP